MCNAVLDIDSFSCVQHPGQQANNSTASATAAAPNAAADQYEKYRKAEEERLQKVPFPGKTQKLLHTKKF